MVAVYHRRAKKRKNCRPFEIDGGGNENGKVRSFTASKRRGIRPASHFRLAPEILEGCRAAQPPVVYPKREGESSAPLLARPADGDSCEKRTWD